MVNIKKNQHPMLTSVFLSIPAFCHLLVSLPYFDGSRYVRTHRCGDDVPPGKGLGLPHPHNRAGLGREGQHRVVPLTSFQCTRRFWPTLAKGRSLQNTVLFHVQSKGVAKHIFFHCKSRTSRTQYSYLDSTR